MIEYFKKKVTLEESNQFYEDNYAIMNSIHSIKNQYSIYNTDKEKAMYVIEILRHNRSFNYEILYFLQEQVIDLSSRIKFDEKIMNYFVRTKDFKLIEKESNYEIEKSNLITANISTKIHEGFVPEIKTNTFHLINNSLHITSELGITNIKIILTRKILQPANSLHFTFMNIEDIEGKRVFMTSQKSSDPMSVHYGEPTLVIEVDNENLVIYSNQEHVYEK